jgi:hypothetical protein
MEFKSCAELSITKGDRVYTLHVPPDAQVGELFDVAMQLLVDAKSRVIAAAQMAMPKEVCKDQAAPEPTEGS